MMRPSPMSVSGFVDGWMCWAEVSCRLNVVQGRQGARQEHGDAPRVVNRTGLWRGHVAPCHSAPELLPWLCTRVVAAVGASVCWTFFAVLPFAS